MRDDEKEALELALKTFCDAANYPMYVATNIGDKDIKRFVGKLVSQLIYEIDVEFKELLKSKTRA